MANKDEYYIIVYNKRKQYAGNYHKLILISLYIAIIQIQEVVNKQIFMLIILLTSSLWI